MDKPLTTVVPLTSLTSLIRQPELWTSWGVTWFPSYNDQQNWHIKMTGIQQTECHRQSQHSTKNTLATKSPTTWPPSPLLASNFVFFWKPKHRSQHSFHEPISTRELGSLPRLSKVSNQPVIDGNLFTMIMVGKPHFFYKKLLIMVKMLKGVWL